MSYHPFSSGTFDSRTQPCPSRVRYVLPCLLAQHFQMSLFRYTPSGRQDWIHEPRNILWRLFTPFLRHLGPRLKLTMLLIADTCFLIRVCTTCNLLGLALKPNMELEFDLCIACHACFWTLKSILYFVDLRNLGVHSGLEDFVVGSLWSAINGQKKIGNLP